MKNVMALHRDGWRATQIFEATKVEKSWEWDGMEYMVEAYFGKLANGKLVVIMNACCQGCGATEVIDDNCDIWKNFFTSTTKDEGNEYYKYLKKHGFKKVEF